MTRVMTAEGKAETVTLLQAEPNIITKVISKEKDGYDAVQLGFGQNKKMKKPQKEALKKVGIDKQFRYLREIKGFAAEAKVGDKVTVAIFEPNEIVRISSISKGKGFAGTVKRHGFHRGPMTHGHDHHRAPGSIGAMGFPRVIPGMRMAGRMGQDSVTLPRVKIIAVDVENNQLLVRGGVPGPRNSLIIVNKK